VSEKTRERHNSDIPHTTGGGEKRVGGENSTREAQGTPLSIFHDRNSIRGGDLPGVAERMEGSGEKDRV